MRILAVILLASLVPAAAQHIDHIGRVLVDGNEEVSLYNKQAGCLEQGWWRAARHPRDKKYPYVMGCWKPVDKDRFRLVFDDGWTMTIHRNQIMSPTQKFSL